jgi:hypothetical protein
MTPRGGARDFDGAVLAMEAALRADAIEKSWRNALTERCSSGEHAAPRP